MEAKIKHLEMIQGVINRMAHNSFLIKGWSVALISALFALAAGGKAGFALLAFVPLVMFWLLDGYFVWQERLFRDLYDHVRKSGDGYSTDEELLFSMDVRLSGLERTWLGAIVSTTLLPFHGAMLAIVIIVTVALAV